MSIRRSRQAGSVRRVSPQTRRSRSGRRSPRTPAAPYAKAATYGEQIRAELAANNPALLVLDREFETQSVDPMFLEPECGLAWYDAGAKNPRARARRAVALRGRGGDRVPAGQGARAVQAGAHQRALRLYRRRLRRTRPYAVPALRRAGGDVLSRPPGPARPRPLSAVPGRHQAARRSRCARGSASIGRPARSAHSPPTTSWMAAASPTIRPSVATVGATARDRHLRRSESRRHDGRAAFARRDRRLDARLRHAADDDGAGGADRRGGGGVAARPDRVPAAQRAQDRTAAP